MRTATQWADEGTRSADFSYETLVARTQAIQRDALLHAAGIAEKAKGSPHDPTTTMQRITATAIERAIQAEADKLK